ncbi:hypothetical protein DFJ74DRAFT_438307 [Hyaloraphidium curvatum]|nr:hypothetical protein DFJ74DRAFT_438307 [Hyaloraphidium curvatum]
MASATFANERAEAMPAALSDDAPVDLCGAFAAAARARLDAGRADGNRAGAHRLAALLSEVALVEKESGPALAVLPELVREVARFLGPKDQLSVALVLKPCYLKVAPLMFRTLDFHAAAVRKDRRLAEQDRDFWDRHRREFSHAVVSFVRFVDSAAPRLAKNKFSYVRRLVLSRHTRIGLSVTVPFALLAPLLPLFTNLRELSCYIESEAAYREFVQADFTTLQTLHLAIYFKPSRKAKLGIRFGNLREFQCRDTLVPALFAALEAQKQDRVVLDVVADNILGEDHSSDSDLTEDDDVPWRLPRVSDWVASRIHTLRFHEWDHLCSVLLRDALKPRRIFSDFDFSLDEGACRDAWELLVRKGSLESAGLALFSSCALVHGLPATLGTLRVDKLRLCHGTHGEVEEAHGDEFPDIRAAIRGRPQECVLDVGKFVVKEDRDGKPVDVEVDEATDSEASEWRLLVGPSRNAGEEAFPEFVLPASSWLLDEGR